MDSSRLEMVEVDMVKPGDLMEFMGPYQKPLISLVRGVHPYNVPGYQGSHVAYPVNMGCSAKIGGGPVKFRVPAPGESLRIRTEMLKNVLKEGFTVTPDYSLGADPEFFVVNEQEEVVPAWEFLPSKEKALFDTSQTKAYWDGVQTEFSIKQAGMCVEYFTNRLYLGLSRIYNALPKGTRISAKSVVNVPEKIRYTAATEHVQLGCMPSRNAYGMEGELVPDGRLLEQRFAGGHIHLGRSQYTMWKPEEKPQVVKFLDATLGVISVWMFRGMEDPIRRRYYGLPGEWRDTSYGLEYRVLPNTWLVHPVYVHLTMELARLFAEQATTGMCEAWKFDEGEVISCIQRSDHRLAQKIITKNRSILVRTLGKKWPKNTRRVVNLVTRGVMKSLKNPDNIAGNWGLGKWKTFDDISAGHSGCGIYPIYKYADSGGAL